jgi:hypothetical protein
MGAGTGTPPAMVRKQHYVWRHYLEGWAAIDGRHLACVREGKLFTPNPKKVGSKNDFYRLEEPTPPELAFVQGFVDKGDEAGRQPRQNWVNSCLAVFKLKRLAAGIKDPLVHAELNRAQNDLEETYLASIETSNVDNLASLRRGEAAFLLSEEGAMEFYYFIAIQYVRTDKLRSSMVAAFEPKVNAASTERIWGLLRQIVAINIGYGLFVKCSTHKITVLEAPESTAFITSDQPVINLDLSGKPEGSISEHLDFYYPLSPRRALRIEDERGDGTPTVRLATLSEVAELNRKMYEASHEQIFGDSKALVKSVAGIAP